MNRTRLLGATVMLVAGLGDSALGGIEPGKILTKSPVMERQASHIVVGKLRAFHEIHGRGSASAYPGMALYAAEIDVAKVEKGTGIEPGGRLFVRFHSPRTRLELETERLVWGCADQKIDPFPGDWLRAYVSLNGDYEYVADHPQGFFMLDRKEAAAVQRERAGKRPLTLTMLGLTAAVGFAVGFVTRSRCPARRRLDESPWPSHAVS